MNSKLLSSIRCILLGAAISLLFVGSLTTVSAASWSGIEPFKSTRADVEKALGQPIADSGADGGLKFKVSGGTVSVYFVGARLIETKKLQPKLEGTVLEVILQHDNSSDTPESLGLKDKKDFVHEGGTGGEVYRNLKDGVIYTFLGGTLKTTRYTASNEQFAKNRV
jgi:hypothetical protein